MSLSRIRRYHLPVSAISDLATGSAAGLVPELTPEGGVERYVALDSFDRVLRRSGQLLLQTDASLVLVGDDGPGVIQALRHEAAFVADIPDGALKHSLAKVSPLRRLLHIGSGELQRARLAFIDDQQKTHCRGSIVYLTTDEGASAAFVTLQALRGYDDAMKGLGARIHELGGVAFNGNALYGWLFPKQPGYDPRPDIPIAADETAFDAATRIIATHVPLARANEPGIIADVDTEFLHHYRVHLRKIRSVLSLFKDLYDDAQTLDLKARFSGLMAPTGRLRDLDVYLLKKDRYYGLIPASLHAGLDALYSMVREQRAIEQAKLSAHLGSKPYRQEITGLALLFTGPTKLKPGPGAHLLAHDYAGKLIWARYRKVCKLARHLDADTPDERVHALRIECKKLRYLMEFFGSVFPAEAFKSVLKPLKVLQDNLGLFNDYSVQQESLRTAMQALSAKGKGGGNTRGGRGRGVATDAAADTAAGVARLDVAQSVGALIAVLHNLQLKERSKVVRNFAQFNSAGTQQTFKELFHKSIVQP